MTHRVIATIPLLAALAFGACAHGNFQEDTSAAIVATMEATKVATNSVVDASREAQERTLSELEAKARSIPASDPERIVKVAKLKDQAYVDVKAIQAKRDYCLRAANRAYQLTRIASSLLPAVGDDDDKMKEVTRLITDANREISEVRW